MTSTLDTQCPAPETIAELAEGKLKRHEIEALLPHIESCATCRTELTLGNRTYHAEARPASARARTWWSVAGAAAAAAVIVVVMLVVARSRSPIDELVAIAPRSARTVEARLTGGFAYAPYGGAMRAGAAPADREQMKLIGTAADVLERAERDSSRDVQRAGAVALVLVNRADEGVVRLAAQAKQSPSDARVWSDLAAAQYASALSGRASLYPEALASANRALQIDPRLPEALFNRALVLERLGLNGEARAAWQRYLSVDPSSPWATEARAHLARLSAEGGAPPFDAHRVRLEAAAAAGDAAVVRELVARHGERARAFSEVEYLGRWAEAAQRNDAAEATRWLTTSRSIATALAATTGESLLRDAVQAIDSADALRRMRIAHAHTVYRRGRIAFSRHELSAAERDLRLAAQQFAAEGDPMSLAARSYAAGARLAQYDVAQAAGELTALLAEVDAARGYLSLAGQVRWELARCMMFVGDFGDAARLLSEAESLFRRGGESVNEATVGTMLAQALTASGRPDDAWRAHVRAFRTLAAAGRIDLLDGAVGGAALIALRAGQMDTARALVAINESLERGMSNDLLLADTLVRKSLLENADKAGAVRAATEATSVAMRLKDPALRARHLAEADVAMAVALLGSDARRAHDLASRALDVFTANGMQSMIAEPYLVRARASLRLGDTAAAERDLGAGMTAVEQHPTRIAGAVIGTSVLDAGNTLFEEAIRRDLARRDAGSAVMHAERRRGVAADAHALAALRARLAGSGTAVVLLVALPREVAALIITERAVTATSSPIAREELASLAARDDDAAAAALFDHLLRPAMPALAGARALIVVPDEMLERVPFAMLRDIAAKRTLLEWMPVSVASSAMALRTGPLTRPPTNLTAVALPTGRDTASVTLPEVELELTEIGGLYRSVLRVSSADVTARAIEDGAGAADVLHIAGHTAADASAGEALVTAGGGVSWRTIAAMREMPPVVVLSACNTLRRPPEPDRRALSLGAAFVVAGAHDVIGTLAPIGDAEARALFFALHEQLARGIAPPVALRRVQLAQRNRPGSASRHLALLTTVIHPIDEE